MSAPFAFPPPPPPPPKATASGPAAPQFSQARGRGRGGFDRGRGRGRGGGGFRGGHQNQFAPSASNFRQHGPLTGANNTFGNYGRTPQSVYGAHDTGHDGHVSKKARLEAPPAIPSFGAPVPSLSTVISTQGHNATTSQPRAANVSHQARQRKTNGLGLTPGQTAEDRDDSSDGGDNFEDDEQEAYRLSQGSGMKFEHRGKEFSLNSGADIKAFLKERRAKWPTNAKIEERNTKVTELKQAQLAAKEQELRQKALESMERARRIAAMSTAKKQEAGETESHGAASIDPSSASVDGLNAQGRVEREAVDESDSSSDNGDSGSESDAPDEETTKRQASAPSHDIAVSADMQQQAPARGEQRDVLCTYFQRGNCRKGRHCAFKHERAERPSKADDRGKRDKRKSEKPMTLYQKWVEQEKTAESKLVLKAIKWLGQHGHLT